MEELDKKIDALSDRVFEIEQLLIIRSGDVYTNVHPMIYLNQKKHSVTAIVIHKKENQ